MKIRNLWLNIKKLKNISNFKLIVKANRNMIISNILILSLTACGAPTKGVSNSSSTTSSKQTTSVESQVLPKETIDSFNYKELFNIDENYSKYESASKDITHNDSKIHGLITSTQLYDIIKGNNNSYMDNMKGASSYKEISNSNLKSICSEIVKTINCYADLINRDELNCVLSEMKIFCKNTFANASVSDNNIMIINDKFFSLFGKPEMTLEEVVSHETIHLMQKSCKDRLAQGEMYIGVSRDFEDESIENFTYSWLYEASAEKCSSYIHEKKPQKYLKEIRYLDLFNFVSLDDEFNLEKICFSKNIDILFNKFRCNNDNDKKELLNLLFTIEIVNNSPNVISQKIYEKYDDTSQVKKQMKRDIYKYYSKLLFSNLSRENKKYSKENIYKIILLYEAIVNNELGLDMSSQSKYNADFLNNYTQLKQDFLSKYSLDLDIDAIKEFSEYQFIVDSNNFSINTNQKNYDELLKSLLEDNKNYIGKFIESEEVVKTK